MVIKSILINRIPEESTVREESLQVEVGGELVDQSKDTVEETGEPDQDINTSLEKDTNNTQVSQHNSEKNSLVPTPMSLFIMVILNSLLIP